MSKKITGSVFLILVVSLYTFSAIAEDNSLKAVKKKDRVIQYPEIFAMSDTIWYSSFEPSDPLGVNIDYTGSSPDQWHVTRRMLYQGATSWITAPVDSYFCHIGDDSLG